MARRFSLGEIKTPREFAFSQGMEKADQERLERLRATGDGAKSKDWMRGSNFRADTRLAVPSMEANLVSSRAADRPESGVHYPIIDFDFPIAVVQSRTPGHYHLYIEKAVRFEQYTALLRAMYDADLIGRGNLRQIDHGGATFARIGPYQTLLAETYSDLEAEARATLVDWDDWNLNGSSKG